MIYLDTLKEGKLRALFSPRPVFAVDEDNYRGNVKTTLTKGACVSQR